MKNRRKPILAIFILLLITALVTLPLLLTLDERRERQENRKIKVDQRLIPLYVEWLECHKKAGINLEHEIIREKISDIVVERGFFSHIRGRYDRHNKQVYIKESIIDGDPNILTCVFWHEMGHGVYGWGHSDSIEIMLSTHDQIPNIEPLKEEYLRAAKITYQNLKNKRDGY